MAEPVIPNSTEAARRIEDPLFETARREPRKTALIDRNCLLTYASLAEWVEQFASSLQRHGVRPGERVSLFFEKSAEAVVTLYGVWAAGAVVVPINDGLRQRQVEYIVRHSGSKYFVASDRKLQAVDRSRLPDVVGIEVEPLRGSTTTRSNCSEAQTEAQLAAILYTSGSTGQPKGVAVSHGNLRAGVRIVSRYLQIRVDERILSVLPFSFDYGLNQLLTAVGCGATLVLQRSLLPADICRSLVDHHITGLAGVPPLWIQLVQRNSPFPILSFPELRYITNSGGMLPISVVRLLRRVLPRTQIYLMYGLTEAFRSTYLSPEEIDRRPDSIGKAIPECHIYVVSDEGRLCDPGEVGELVHRGPTVALGYWQDEEATKKKFRPNPFSTDPSEMVVYSGDYVKQDEDGFLYFVGRRDEMIKSLAYRVSPTEVEETVYQSGMVTEVVAKGVPDPVCGSVVVVHCVPARPHEFSVDDLLAFCRREMPTYMVPKSVVIHASLPRTASGKVDRKAVVS